MFYWSVDVKTVRAYCVLTLRGTKSQTRIAALREETRKYTRGETSKTEKHTQGLIREPAGPIDLLLRDRSRSQRAD